MSSLTASSTVEARAPRRSHLVRTTLALGLVVAAAGCGRSSASEPTAATAQPTSTAAQPQPTSTTVPRPTETLDELVPVNGARMHVRCTGHGDRTVVVLAGFTDDGASWSDMTPTIAQKTRVCTYSRFGLGTSDKAPTPQTFATQAHDLRTALDTLREPGPYVVVGHSFGGPAAVSFTAQNPGDVTGLLLLDASPTTWHDASCAVPNDGSAKSQEFQLSCTMAHAPENNAERLDGPAAFAGVATINSLGAVPMIVATRTDLSYPGMAPAEQQRLKQVWEDGQQHWVSLSTSSRLVPVERTGHMIHVDRPDVVLDQIDQLLTAHR